MSANFIVNVMNVAGALVFARLLGVEIIAQYGLLIVTLELMLLPLNFGFNQAVIRFSQSQTTFSVALLLVVGQALGYFAVFTVVLFGAAVIGLDLAIASTAALLICLSKALSCFVTLGYAPLEKELRYGPIAKAKVIATGIAIAVGLSIALSREPTVYALIARDVLNAVIMLSIVVFTCNMRFVVRWEKKQAQEIWKFVRPIWLLNILERATIRLDYALVAVALDTISFGIYFQIRALLEGALGFFLNPIQTVVYAYYCKVVDAQSVLKKVLRSWLLPVSAATAIFAAILFSTDLGGWIVGVLLGADWVVGGALLGGLFVYSIAMIVFEHSKVVALVMHRQRAAVMARLVQLITICALVIPAVSVLGLLGAGLASGIAAFLLAATTTVLVVIEDKVKGSEGQRGE